MCLFKLKVFLWTPHKRLRTWSSLLLWAGFPASRWKVALTWCGSPR